MIIETKQHGAYQFLMLLHMVSSIPILLLEFQKQEQTSYMGAS